MNAEGRRKQAKIRHTADFCLLDISVVGWHHRSTMNMNKNLNIPPSVWLVVTILLSSVIFVFLALSANEAWKALNIFRKGVPAVGYYESKVSAGGTKYSFSLPTYEYIFQKASGVKTPIWSHSDAPQIEVIYIPDSHDQIPSTFIDWVKIILDILIPIFVICMLIIGYKKEKKRQNFPVDSTDTMIGR